MHRHLVTGLALVVLVHGACHTADEGLHPANGIATNTCTSTSIHSNASTALTTDSGTGTSLATGSGTGTTLATDSGTGTSLATDSAMTSAVPTDSRTAVATNSVTATGQPTDLGTAWQTDSTTGSATETITGSHTGTTSVQTASFSASVTSTAKETGTRCRSLPAAPPASQACGLLLDTVTGNRLNVDVTADVTVSAVGAVTSSPCLDARRIDLATKDGRTFRLDLSITGLPADFIKRGDRLALKMTHWSRGRSIMYPPVSQSVVLSREGKTVLLAWTGTGSAVSASNPTGRADAGAPTSASAGGLDLVEAGLSCAGGNVTGGFCVDRFHVAQVTIGSQSVLLDPRTTLPIGGMQVVLGDYYDAIDTGICDSFSELSFAAFAL